MVHPQRLIAPQETAQPRISCALAERAVNAEGYGEESWL